MKDVRLGLDRRRILFDCGRSGVVKLGLIGSLAAADGGMLAAQKAEIAWDEGQYVVRRVEATFARATEIALADGLVCRFSGKGAAPAFEGRRANYSCGIKDGATVALLGELEPAGEGAFRILRARVGHAESGFALLGTEEIRVSGPR
jgi:hypothetical protein